MKSHRGITERSEHHGSGSKRGRRYVLLFAALVIVYSANGRDIGAADAQPTMMLAVSLARGDGLVLDRYFPATSRLEGPALLGRVQERSRCFPLSGRHGIVGPAAHVSAGSDTRFPAARLGRNPRANGLVLAGHRENSAMMIAALTAILILYLLCSLELGRAAMPATLVVALGSPLWTIASQSLWQHGPVALALTCSSSCCLRSPASLAVVPGGFCMAAWCGFDLPRRLRSADLPDGGLAAPEGGILVSALSAGPWGSTARLQLLVLSAPWGGYRSS